jgi:DNA-binding CsgD family transcriptional regulator
MYISPSSLQRIHDLGQVLTDIDNMDDFRVESVSRLSTLFSASASAFMHWADADGKASKMKREDIFFTQMDENYQELYFSEVLASDPLTRWVSNRPGGQQVFTLVSITSPQQLRRSALYREILSPNNNHDILTISLNIGGKLLGNISLSRAKGFSVYEKTDVELAQLLAPMLSATYYNRVLSHKILDADTTPKACTPESSETGSELKQHSPQYWLSTREKDIVRQLEKGLTAAKIGEQLAISPWTVKNHLQSIYRKVGVNNRVSLLNKLSCGYG